ncbi:hypothetical protein NQ315_011455 [Exocentrus adspersus]|uniref:MADF domain-containing protein n=1 Tax=Exocentrus adspersus TaxID=1586481 RepID=A0AAV8VUG0_9CUCU|nr:hypothetical protein NQ315_011455 [Exocentrus adspersus]
MNEIKTWSVDEVHTLIYQWRAHPELWDVKNKQYRNKVKKQAALSMLAAEFATTESEIYRKFHNLRTQFHQELRRTKVKKCLDETYRSSWKFYDAMRFIVEGNHNVDVSKQHNYKQEVDEEILLDDDSEQIEFIDPYKESEEVLEKRLQIHLEDVELDPISFVKKPQAASASKSTDDFQVFGDFVACELRNLRSKENQKKLKRAIQRAILDISELDDNGNDF